MSWMWSFQHEKHVTIFAFSSFSLLAVLLLHYLRLYLDLIAPPSLSSLMTASRADRQIYLHWWREGKREEKVISKGPVCRAAQTRAGGAWSELRPCGSSPYRAYLSLCCPWASEFSAGWDQSLTRLTQSHISLSGGIESRRRGLWPALVPAAQQQFHKASDLFFPYITFLLEPLMSQAPAFHLHPELTRRGQSARRKIEWLYFASPKRWTCTVSIMTLLGSEHSVLIRSKFRSGKSPEGSVWEFCPVAVLLLSGGVDGAFTGRSLYTNNETGVCVCVWVKYWCSEGYQREAVRGQRIS